MGSVGNPKVWVPLPYMNNKDCSQGFCTLYCPQWCYIIFPPPPPPFGFVTRSGPNISPVVAAIMGILVSALLLVGYYTIISKYCGNSNSSSGRGSQVDPDEDFGENDDSPRNGHGPWHNIPTAGLDEAMIKSIAVCRYERGDGLVQGTDCSVCLGEFRGGETLRLLPKCSHAFHVWCIDTWLKSHSNCPLCRAVVLGPNASAPLQSPAPLVIENRQSNEPSSEREERNENVGESGVITQTNTVIVTKTQSDSGNSDYVGIEIRDGDVDAGRSASMDHLRVPVAGVLRLYG